jgi:hypothetical protein
MGATMAMIVLSSPATLTGAEEKKTGPSRFSADFFSKNYQREVGGPFEPKAELIRPYGG